MADKEKNIDIASIAGIAQALSALTNSVTNVADTKKRRNFEQNLALLDYDEKKKLNAELLKANSEQAKQQLLINTLSDVGKSRLNAINEEKLQKQKNRKAIIITSVIAGTILIASAVFIYLKKRKNGN